MNIETTKFTKPEKNYREIEALNCSMLKVYKDNRYDFYNQFVLGKKKEDTDKWSTLIGSLVDFYMIDCYGDENEFQQQLPDYFKISETVRNMSQSFDLADELYLITLRCLNEDGVITESFSDRFSQACDKVRSMGKYSGKDNEKILDDFNKKAKSYFDDKMDSINKKVIDISHINKAKYIIDQVKKSEIIHGLLFTEHHYIDHIRKLVIEWEYKDPNGKFIRKCKSEIDFLSIDHKDKIIRYYDLKTTYDNELFYFNYFKFGYYLQASFYYLAVMYWANEQGYSDYEIYPIEFIVCDTSSKGSKPLIYSLEFPQIQKGVVGFERKGFWYKGVEELMTEINWSIDTQTWNISMENFLNNGLVKLPEY